MVDCVVAEGRCRVDDGRYADPTARTYADQVIRRTPDDSTAPPVPLTRWQSFWRYTAVILLGAFTWVERAVVQWQQDQLVFWLEASSGAVALVLYHYRRRHPLAVVTALLLLAAVSSPAAGPALLALVSLATRRRWREIAPMAGLGLLTGAAYGILRPDPELPGLALNVINVLFTGAAVAIGLYIGARRELLATLQDRAERAEREQAARVAQARANERSRIAREMHDVLAHRISLVAMHAGALDYRTDLSSEESKDLASTIQGNAHHALADLREILGVLREDTVGEVPERPQPTLNELAALLEDERGTGARIEVRSRVEDLSALPESLSRTGFRILQEALTNARKHAPHTKISVTVAGRRGRELLLLVRNPLPVGSVPTMPGAGLGLAGLTERAELSGGQLEHGVRREHFVVRARLPWPA